MSNLACFSLEKKRLDMEKTYDRLEWNPILVMLQKLGFHPWWIGWIEQCISTVSFSILVNGILGDKFSPFREIRQGDLLLPYLFIMCAELLDRSLHFHSSSDHKLSGAKIGRSSMKVPFLTFAERRR